MFSVFAKHLLTDMQKTIFRKYVHTTDAQLMIQLKNYNLIQHLVIDFFPMKRHLKSWDSEGRFPLDRGRVICQLIRYLQKFFAI